MAKTYALDKSVGRCWWLHCRGKPSVTVKLPQGKEITLCTSCYRALKSKPDPKRYLRLVAPWLFEASA